VALGTGIAAVPAEASPVAPAPSAALAISTAVAAAGLLFAALGGSVAAVALEFAAAPASAAVAPAVTVALLEGLAGALPPGGRFSRLAAAEQALQPAEEAACGRLCLLGSAVRLERLLGAGALLELRALIALRLVAAEVASLRTRLAAVVPAVGAERGPALADASVRAVAGM